MIPAAVDIVCAGGVAVCLGIPGYSLAVDLRNKRVDLFHFRPEGWRALGRFRLIGEVGKNWSKTRFCPVYPVAL